MASAAAAFVAGIRFQTDDVSVDVSVLTADPNGDLLTLDGMPSISAQILTGTDSQALIATLTEENSRLKAEIQSLQQTIETQGKKFQADLHAKEQKFQADLDAKDNDQKQILLHMQQELLSQGQQMRTGFQKHRECCDVKFTIINQNLCAVAVQHPMMAFPGVRVRNFSALDQRPCNHVAIKSVGEAWLEWNDGIGGNRAVKDWDSKHHTHTTYKRDGLYHCLRDLVDSGRAPATAISLIEKEYSGSRSRSILKMSADLKKRKRDGTLPPSLRV